jgi:diaminohydroxyphosphoribosylaminopyrimidine deaminase/5-amino-6-(5-phosphoribosylamino)uracil reductase
MLAERGTGSVSPNPRVGCVIADAHGIIAEGWHELFGGPHAEANALARITRPLTSDATLYVNLEPCSHTGKQPPCSDAIIASGIRRVVVGMVDPNPLVGGRGIDRLRSHGIDVVVGVAGSECAWINRTFVKYITTGTPYVIAKAARTINGTIAPDPYHRMELTGAATRRAVHFLRAECDAVMVGVDTVITDDPQLNVRDVSGRDPLRIILDTNLRTPIDSKIMQTAAEQRTMIYTTAEHADSQKADALRGHGADIAACVRGADGRLDLGEVLSDLGRRQIASVLCEAGPRLTSALISEGMVDELRIHTAAIVEQPGNGLHGAMMSSAWDLRDVSVSEQDILAVYLPHR